MQLGTFFVFWFFFKLNVNLYEPMITFLEIYPREMWSHVHSKICTWMFIIALFIIAPNWKQSKCPSTRQCINKLWYIHPMEYNSAIRRNKLLSHVTTRVNLNNIMLSEGSQTQKTMYCMILFTWNFQKRQTHRGRKQTGSCLVPREGAVIDSPQACRDSGAGGNVLKWACGDSCTTA